MSACIKKCVLGPDGRCTGCGRSMTEIEAAGRSVGLPDRRAEAEERLMIALRDAVQLVYDQTGIRLDHADLTWGEREVQPGVFKHIVRKVNVCTTAKEQRSQFDL